MNQKEFCEPTTPVYLLKSVRDQFQSFQERRGVRRDENNFVNLIAVIAQQSGQALYTVSSMFLALLPIITIFIHAAHFTIDRLLDVLTTRKRKDCWCKALVFLAQLTLAYIALGFVVRGIFMPILSMELTILSKMLFYEDDGSC